MRDKNRYRVVFRSSSVVDESFIYAADIVKAAKKAERMTEPGGKPYVRGWSVYSITLS